VTMTLTYVVKIMILSDLEKVLTIGHYSLKLFKKLVLKNMVLVK